MVDIFDQSNRITGERTFGLDVGLAMKHTCYGLWMEYSATAPTLREAIHRAINTTHFQQSGGRIRLDYEGPNAVIRYCLPEKVEFGMPYFDHIIYPLLSFISVYLLYNERATWIELPYKKDVLASKIEDRFQEPIHFGTGYTGIAFKASILDRVRKTQNLKRNVTYLDVAASELKPIPTDTIPSITSILVLRLLDGLTDIDGAAQTAGIGVQTLQRILRHEGTSYRQLLDKIRLNKAKALLNETSLNVTEIGLTLGYSEHGNFTRAFNRWVGCSPSNFRNQVAAG
jgi:AraC-like DNA-binding protein